MAFTPDGRIFIAQRTGTVRIIKGGTVISEPFAILPVSAKSEAGLLGLALHPQFQDNGYVYLYYTYQNGNTLRNRVVRLVNQGNRGVDPVVILDGIPGGNIHDGGRIMFGPDGKLYITTGDAGDSSLSQRLDSLGGKVLRLNDDGTVPQDNPFPGSPIYSLGHRNVQGLAWHPINGQLFVTEHGPSARDEVNAIVAGKNYGWPTVRGIAKDPRFADPIIESRDSTWAPSGATFYTGDKLPEGWRGKLFFSGLRGQQIHWISLEGPEYNRVMDQGSLFEGTFGRVRTVVQGPDGYLYFATNNTDGRGSPAPEDDRILRIVPNK
jgi:glucose/arabinose dehydrogenase